VKSLTGSYNGRQLFQFFHASTNVPNVPKISSADDPVSPSTLDSLDNVDDVTHANKKSRVPKTNTTHVARSQDELADYFKKPVTDLPGYKWQPENLVKDKLNLLYYHRFFGHAGLRHICRIIKTKLGSGLPELWNNSQLAKSIAWSVLSA
jgi:hypothetical protein